MNNRSERRNKRKLNKKSKEASKLLSFYAYPGLQSIIFGYMDITEYDIDWVLQKLSTSIFNKWLKTQDCQISYSPGDGDVIITEYRINGYLHRFDGPARAWSDGDENYFQRDLLHRTDGPAVVFNGDRLEWYILGKLQRRDELGDQRQDQRTWFRDGVKHRDDGLPAIICSDFREWYVDGKLHRLDGPAIVYFSGNQRDEYWRNGVFVRYDE